jgi:hypothetical protein
LNKYTFFVCIILSNKYCVCLCLFAKQYCFFTIIICLASYYNRTNIYFCCLFCLIRTKVAGTGACFFVSQSVLSNIVIVAIIYLIQYCYCNYKTIVVLYFFVSVCFKKHIEGLWKNSMPNLSHAVQLYFF